jgi:DNA polymerase III delta prime subunit
MSKLLPNLPIESLTEENDYIGIIKKGTLLKSFFLNNKNEFSRIKIFSIYGEWGSGKSTLMKYLQKELKGSFNTFFFESWEFESDENLSLSLLEYLTKKNQTKLKKVGKELLEIGEQLLEGFARSITFKTPVLNVSSDKLIETISKDKELTFLELKEKFKEDFIKWENTITSGKKDAKYNVVFIDDLDRCEPENILNLLSAMKLFFTYGKKTIFLCGIDKKAIREAVKTKYGEIVKANEYLEKIFDISFSMPTAVNNSKLISQYFDDDEKVGEEKLSDLITKFFEELHFKNPRRIKKILNKYHIIKRLKENEKEEDLILPNIIYKDKGTLFETYLTLYLLILKEFEPKNFNLLFDLSYKRVNYVNSLKKNYPEKSNYETATSSTIRYLEDYDLDRKLFADIITNNNSANYSYFIALFAPTQVDNLFSYAFSSESNFLKLFIIKNKSFEYYFTIFLFRNQSRFISNFNENKYSLIEYKNIVSNLI